MCVQGSVSGHSPVLGSGFESLCKFKAARAGWRHLNLSDKPELKPEQLGGGRGSKPPSLPRGTLKLFSLFLAFQGKKQIVFKPC